MAHSVEQDIPDVVEERNTLSPSHSDELPPQEGTEEEKTTVSQTLVHLVKGYIGPGCLSLPWAMSQLGVVGGCLAAIILSCWSSHNCWTVVQVKRWIVREEGYSPSMTYPDVGEWAYGHRFRSYVTTCIIVQQLAICTVFLSFIGENSVAVLQRIMDGHVSHTVVITLALPAVLALACIPNLRGLAPVTAIGTALLLVAFSMLSIVVVENWQDRPSRPRTDWSTIPLALCAILYSYEGICLILPIETAMKDPTQFGKPFVIAMVIVAIVFSSVGSICVLAFGEVDNGSITAFLLGHEDDLVGNSRTWVLLANTVVTLSVLLTYPLQLFPCLELVGPCLSGMRRHHQQRQPSDQFEPLPDSGDVEAFDSIMRDDDDSALVTSANNPGSPRLRLLLVLLTYAVAIAIPNVQVLISLAGAVAGSSTALLIPPLLELEWFKRGSGRGRSIHCYILFGMGLLFCLIGTGASIADIARLYTS